jgi:UDP-glucose:(heptosyl)LPS alpha-1,3-glucosyltransferase
MRIAFVVHDYHRNGGHARYVAELASRFAAEHEVHVFSNTFEADAGDGVRHHHVRAIRSNALATILSFAPVASRALRRAGPFDIVHAQGFCGWTQDVMTVHMTQAGWFAAMEQRGVAQSVRKRIFRAIVSRIESRAYRADAARTFIAISERTRSDLARHYGLRTGVQVLHHGIDTAVFNPAQRTAHRDTIRREHAIAADACVALYVGDWQKAGRSLLDALAQSAGVSLLVVTKSDPTAVHADIVACGQSDRVTVVTATRAIEAYYAAADLFAFPSVYDTFGMVVAEAMASALPVVVSAAAGASEWIEDGRNGIVIPSAADSRAFARAMTTLAADAALRERLGAAARRTALEHPWDRVAVQTMEIYRRVLRERAHA